MIGTRWMLRVHYDRGPNFCDNEQIRNREYQFDSKLHVINLRSEILLEGLMDNNHKYSTPKHTGLTYEYWVAPSQIFGFEVIEYK